MSASRANPAPPRPAATIKANALLAASSALPSRTPCKLALAPLPALTDPLEQIRHSFTLDENVSTQSKVKSSVMRGIVKGIEREYPCFNNALDQLLPKKEMAVAKWCAGPGALACTWRCRSLAAAAPPPAAPPAALPPCRPLTACRGRAQPRAPERRAAGSDAEVL